MSLLKYLPPVEKISQEVVVQLVAVLVAALIISKVPAFKAIVSGNTLNPLENPPV